MSTTWNDRFAVSGHGTPVPPDALTDRLDGVDRTALLPAAGRALDVACGRGGVAVWLAARGLRVDAVDAAPEGLARGAELARHAGVAVRWTRADLDDGLPVAGSYDVVVCQRFRDPALWPALVRAVAPGGVLVASVLSEVGAGPGRFRAAPGELIRAAAGLDLLAHVEAHGEASLVARRPALTRGGDRRTRPDSARGRRRRAPGHRRG